MHASAREGAPRALGQPAIDGEDFEVVRANCVAEKDEADEQAGEDGELELRRQQQMKIDDSRDAFQSSTSLLHSIGKCFSSSKSLSYSLSIRFSTLFLSIFLFPLPCHCCHPHHMPPSFQVPHQAHGGGRDDEKRERDVEVLARLDVRQLQSPHLRIHTAARGA
eukprot:1450802-Pleurochrysis_carterae.AAC.1